MVGEWPAKKIARLRVLWAEGLSTSLIGEKMGVTKSSIIGKVHRLKLPSRPSPIRRNAAKVKPPELPIVVAPPPIEALEASKRQRGTGVLAGPTLPAATAPPTPAFQRHTSRVCCWPSWPDSERPPRPPIFCGEPSEPERVYCLDHCLAGYVSYKPREIADAA